MSISKQQFAEEERRMRKLRRDGWNEVNIRSWLRQWRAVGVRLGLYKS